MKNQQLEQTPPFYLGILQATSMKGSVLQVNYYSFIDTYESLKIHYISLQSHVLCFLLLVMVGTIGYSVNIFNNKFPL